MLKALAPGVADPRVSCPVGNVHFLYRNTDTWPAVTKPLHLVVPVPVEVSAAKRAVTALAALAFCALGLLLK